MRLLAVMLTVCLGGIEGRELVVTLQVPAEATAEQTRRAVEAQIVKSASFQADGVVVAVREVTDEKAALIRDFSSLAAKHETKLWIAVQLPDQSAADVAGALASLPVEGLALLLPPPKGEPTDPAKRAELLAIKRRGDKLGESIRELKRRLGPQKKLALGTAISEIAPETARSQYVPAGDLIRDGVIDVLALGDAERMNFHRFRLLRDGPLRVGSFLDASSSDKKRRAGLLGRSVLEVVQNETCELLWLCDFPVETVGHVVPAAVEGLRQSQTRRAALESSLAKGELVVDQEISEKDCNDQASLHGVAQSFTPSRDGSCPLVQVYAAIRGSQGPLPPPMHVEIRDDENGKPGSRVLAKTDIPAAEFGLEPAYRLGNARLDPPVPLKKGQTYWLYLTNTSHPDGNYVWRIVKEGAGPRGRAWSKRYDYGRHAWVFRVYLSREPSR